MDIKREDKEKATKLYEEHFELLLAVYKIGNKVMLQRQLYILCKRLGIKKYENIQYFNRVVRDMEKVQMIERYNKDGKNNHKWIILRNPCITKVAGDCEKLYGYSHNKETVKKSDRTEDRFGKSIFKAEYLIQQSHPTFTKSNNIKNIQDLIMYHMEKTSLLYESTKSYPYMSNFFKSYNKYIKLNDYEVNKILEELKEVEKIKKESNPYVLKKLKESRERGEESDVEYQIRTAREIGAYDFNNILERRCCVYIDKIETNTDKRKDKLEFLQSNQVIQVHIDMFDTKDNVELSTMGSRIRETAKTVYYYFEGFKRYNFDKCYNCKDMTSCIMDGYPGISSKKLKIDCHEMPGEINRVVKFTVTIYSSNEKSRILMKEKCEKKAPGSNLTALDIELNKHKYFGGNLTTDQMKITYKSLDLDKKYSVSAKNKSKIEEYSQVHTQGAKQDATLNTKVKNEVGSSNDSLDDMLSNIRKEDLVTFRDAIDIVIKKKS